MNMGKRVLLLVLSCSVLTFFILSIFSSWGMFRIREALNESGQEMVDHVMAYGSEISEEESRQFLLDVTREEADLIDHEIESGEIDKESPEGLRDFGRRLGSSAGRSDVVSFLLDRQGKVLMVLQGQDGNHGIQSGKSLLHGESRIVSGAVERMMAGERDVVSTESDGVGYYLAFSPLKSAGWSYGKLTEANLVKVPMTETQTKLWQDFDRFQESMDGLYRGLFAGALILWVLLLAAFLQYSVHVSRSFVEPIHQLTEGVREITRGNLDKQLDVRTGDELEHLSASFNAMSHELKAYMDNLTAVSKEKERIAAELNVAAGIQAGMLPRDFSELSLRHDMDLYADMQPAREVGGDFYDFYLRDDNHLVLTIADVSGKGIPAALFMVKSKTVLKNYAAVMSDPEDLSGVMACTNDQLCQNNEEDMFVTVFTGILDLETGEFVYVNGGHNPPLIGRLQPGGSRSFEELPVKKSCALGLMEGLEFPCMKLVLRPGDMLFLYTDGVTEALNEAQELYSEKRLKEVLDKAPGNASAEEILAFLRKDIRSFVGDAEQSDDITMMGFLYQGAGRGNVNEDAAV